MKRVKKVINSIALLMFFSMGVFSVAKAQEDQNASAQVDEAILKEMGITREEFDATPQSNYVPPVTIDLKEATFDEESRKLKVNATLKNNTNTFLDDLEYTIEMRKGEVLAEDGYIFSTTDHVYQDTKIFGKLEPNESKNSDFSIESPITVPAGNYFINLYVNDKNFKFQDVDYTESPIYISGTNEAFYNVITYLYTEKYGKANWIEGLSASPEEKPLILIPLRENEVVKEYVESGKKIFTKIDISGVWGDKELAKSVEGEFRRMIVAGEDVLAFELEADNEMLKKGGSFDVFVNLLGEDGASLYKMKVRWFIEYGQLIGRIVSVDITKNVYKKGEGLEASAIISTLNGQDKKGVIEISVSGMDGERINFSKEIFLDEGSEVDFSDQIFSEKLKLKEVNVVLKNEENGDVLDSYKLDVETDKNFGSGASIARPVWGYWLIIVIAFGALIAIVVSLAKSKRGKMMIFVLGFLFLSGAMFFSQGESASAQCLCASRSASDFTNNFWVSLAPPVSVTCGQSATMEVKLTTTCTNCANGMASTINSSDGSATTQNFSYDDNNTNYTTIHRFSQRINSTGTTIWATAKHTKNGCHCCPDATNIVNPRSGCLLPSNPTNDPAFNAGCYINKPIATISRTVNCTTPPPTPINGTCGTNAKTYAATATAWPSLAETAFCATGNNPTANPPFPTQGSSVSWICSGLNGGAGATCNASRLAVPAPTVYLNPPSATVSVGGSVTLRWTTTNTSSCTASGSWSGAKTATGGSQSITYNTIGAYTYNISCVGTNGATVTDTSVVTVTSGPACGTPGTNYSSCANMQAAGETLCINSSLVNGSMTQTGNSCDWKCSEGISIGIFSDNKSSEFSCNATLTPSPVCGNEIIEGTEQCDDGNTTSGDGCSSTCQNEVVGCVPNGTYSCGSQTISSDSCEQSDCSDCTGTCSGEKNRSYSALCFDSCNQNVDASFCSNSCSGNLPDNCSCSGGDGGGEGTNQDITNWIEVPSSN